MNTPEFLPLFLRQTVSKICFLEYDKQSKISAGMCIRMTGHDNKGTRIYYI